MENKHFYIAVLLSLVVVQGMFIGRFVVDLSAAESARDAYKLQSERYLEALRKANSEINKANKLYDSGLIINLTDIK